MNIPNFIEPPTFSVTVEYHAYPEPESLHFYLDENNLPRAYALCSDGSRREVVGDLADLFEIAFGPSIGERVAWQSEGF